MHELTEIKTRQKEIQLTHKQTDRHVDRSSKKKTGRQAGREREREREYSPTEVRDAHQASSRQTTSKKACLGHPECVCV